MKLRGHKKGCRCVACSPATRRRGMAALRGHRNRPRRRKRRPARAARRIMRRARPVIRRRRQLANPVPRGYIGSNIRIYPGGLFRGSRLYATTDPRVICLESSRSPRLGLTIRRVDYDNRGKALRAYGRPGRFRHDFRTHVRVERSHTNAAGKRLTFMRAPVDIWKRG